MRDKQALPLVVVDTHRFVGYRLGNKRERRRNDKKPQHHNAHYKFDPDRQKHGC